jgi:hypothetical protein
MGCLFQGAGAKKMRSGLLLLLMVGSAISLAQGPESGGQGRGGFGGRMARGFGASSSAALLSMSTDAEVQKALGVTDEQKGYLEILRDQVKEETDEFNQSIESLSGEERFAKMRERMEKRGPEIEGDLKEVLGEKSFGRLKQIRTQMVGVMEWMNPDTAREIGLTEDQQSQLRDTMREQFSQIRGVDREQMRSKMAEMRKSMEEKALAMLTDKQKERWQAMLGEPAGIDFDRLQRSLRPEGGRGNRGEGRGEGRRNRSRPENAPPAETTAPSQQ